MEAHSGDVMDAKVDAEPQPRMISLPNRGGAMAALDLGPRDRPVDIVFSHGVLHHVPEIRRAQDEIHRVLRPHGLLVAMLYARRSLNYQASIRWVRRGVLAAAYPLRHTSFVPSNTMLRAHLANAERMGLSTYLRMGTFTHVNTDGPHNPFAKVYSRRQVRADFPDFVLERSYQRYMHAPPLPVQRLPGAGVVGWHLWVHLRARGTHDGAPAGGGR